MKDTSTLRVTAEEKFEIEQKARKEGIPVYKYIPFILDEKCPISETPIKNTKSKERTSVIGFIIPSDIKERVNKNIEELSSRFRTITISEYILSLVLDNP